MDVRSRLALFLTSVLVLSSPLMAASQAQESTSSTWWNPMSWGAGSSAPTERKSAYFNGESKKEKSDKPLFSFPSLPWSSSETELPAATAPKPSGGPTMLSKMGQSTRQAMANTADFLNPFNDSAPKPPAAYEPPQQGYQPQNLSKTTTTTKGSGPFGWLWREERTEQPGSVNDFLRQERPRF